jgi:hypothetical protein
MMGRVLQHTDSIDRPNTTSSSTVSLYTVLEVNLNCRGENTMYKRLYLWHGLLIPSDKIEINVDYSTLKI